jgi:hypothetical protein
VVKPPLELPPVSNELPLPDTDPLAPPGAPPDSPREDDAPMPAADSAFAPDLAEGRKLVDKFWEALSAGAKKAGPPLPAPAREERVADPPRTPTETVRDAPPTATTTDAAPSGQRLLVVGDAPGPNHYFSLHAACSEAADGDTIELRYSGRRAPERPIEISNIKLAIRAGQGFRPLVAFQPQQDFKTPPAMISVAGGALAVSDVDWEFVLPRNVPPHWALFETRGCDLLEFRRCTLTVQGQTAYQARVAFFDVKAPPGVKSMNMDGSATAMDAHVVAIDLHDCVARGEATFLRDDELQSVRLNWENGLLATSDHLLVAGGSSLQPRHDVRAAVTLRHVTAMVAAGLVLLTNSEESPYQLMTQVRCDDCILVARGRPPLVEQRGSDRIDQYQTRFQWSGDNDYFDGFDVFWRIMNAAGQSGAKQLGFDEWNLLWQGTSRNQVAQRNAVVWAGLPTGERPFHAHTPSDYALDGDAVNNPAAGGAGNRQDAGFRLIDLPPAPSQPRPADSRLDTGS